MNSYDPLLLELLENPHLSGAEDDGRDGLTAEARSEQGHSPSPATAPAAGP